MRAGKLRRRVQLQKRVASTDAEGSPQENWSAFATVWAAVEPLNAREYLLAAQAGVQVTHQVTVRYRSDVTHNHRVVEGTRVLDVRTVIHRQERLRELDLLCVELQPT